MMWFVPMKTAERLDGAALRLVCRQATIATMQAAIAATADQSISAAPQLRHSTIGGGNRSNHVEVSRRLGSSIMV
jgi:hypothetical protein